MATINISDLSSTPVTQIQSEELLNAVSDSVARAIKARGQKNELLFQPFNPPILYGLLPAFPDKVETLPK